MFEKSKQCELRGSQQEHVALQHKFSCHYSLLENVRREAYTHPKYMFGAQLEFSDANVGLV